MSTSNKLTPHQPIHHYTANSSNYQIQVTQFTIQIKLSPKSSPGPTKQNGKKKSNEAHKNWRNRDQVWNVDWVFEDENQYRTGRRSWRWWYKCEKPNLRRNQSEENESENGENAQSFPEWEKDWQMVKRSGHLDFDIYEHTWACILFSWVPLL